MRPRVVVDANVLWSPHQRNLVLQIADQDVIDVRWSARIVEEWLRNVEPAQRSRIEASTIPLMERHFPNAMLPPSGSPEVGSTDLKDRHVAATAILAAPCVLLTWNLADFDRLALAERGVEVLTPDDLLSRLFDERPTLVLDIVRQAQANLTLSAPTWEAYMQVLARSRLDGLVARLRAAMAEAPVEGIAASAVTASSQPE